ncbi:lipopolysaccharide biosynthesis protein [Candidatus Allofournierella merdipullorum]|uniref:lipopolysaccharide biosynthesis protein n=1 Tax=Candidatus Allofournierella merdipullorum TaxID=2838595 RepID=UPI003AB72A91
MENSQSSRTISSIRNAAYGLLNQLVILVLGFVSRTVFLHFLNETYLGINSLFSEILSMLSLADLGLATVMAYTFYKPLAENDGDKINALLAFYKNVYRLIAAVVSVVGLLLLPFLGLIVNTAQPVEGLRIYYLLFLSKTVISYLFVYKTTILTADQKGYLVSNVSTITKIATVACQITAIIITKNFVVYLLVEIFFTWFNNYLCAKRADRLYHPSVPAMALDAREKKEIFFNIKAGFIYKLSSVLLNSTDNTLISVLLSTELVGLYSNYGMVFSRLSMFVNIFFSSLAASVGNLIVLSDKKNTYRVFSTIQIIGFSISTITSVCCFVLMSDFVKLWIGEKYVFGMDVLIACVLNYYFSIALQPLWIYRDATGLYKKTKYVMLCTAAVNLVLSIALGRVTGLAGIIFASVIARLATYFWYEPCILFKSSFDKKAYHFFLQHAYNFGVTAVLCFAGTAFFSKAVIVENFLDFIVKAMAVVAFSLLGVLAANVWRKDFRQAMRFLGSRCKMVLHKG